MAARGGGAKSGGALPNLRSFGPKTAIFAKNIPLTRASAQTKEDGGHNPVRLDFTVSKSPLVPFNSTICPRTAQKGAKKPQKRRNMHQRPETKHGPYPGLRGSKSDSQGT